MRLFIFHIALLIVVLTSCSSNSNERYITQINQLSEQLEDAASIYYSIDSIGIVNIRKRVKNNSSKLKYIDDSTFNKVAVQYGNIVKSIKQILKMDVNLKKEYQISSTQISDLLHDANNNIIDTTLLIQYIEEEKKAIEKLINHMNYNYERIIIETNKYDSLNPLIENYLNTEN